MKILEPIVRAVDKKTGEAVVSVVNNDSYSNYAIDIKRFDIAYTNSLY